MLNPMKLTAGTFPSSIGSQGISFPRLSMGYTWLPGKAVGDGTGVGSRVAEGSAVGAVVGTALGAFVSCSTAGEDSACVAGLQLAINEIKSKNDRVLIFLKVSSN